ncbi:MAG TPA: pantoate--beta-alanine ligase [Candidatus Sulfotelmatobacter sp.]|nr:pantoate--beta-alanine ligase [Candidatus Sulfotelmatobacter sp.]
MFVLRTPAEVRKTLADLPRPVGLVATLGALHAGHLALVERARAECATVVATIFVNPLQFGPNEDFDRYPRTFESDAAAFEAAGVDLLYAPAVETMYPPDFGTSIDAGPVAAGYEGALRPGHFRGVATVCVKLFSTVGAERAYFGQKDAQQVAVLRRVVADLNLPVELVVLPTVREADGLALSSRNVYLDPEQRAVAPTLHRALSTIADAVRAGESREQAVALGRTLLVPPAREAYLDVVDRDRFVPAESARHTLAVGSVWLGTTRLIDNEPIEGGA